MKRAEETETMFTQTAAERRAGVWHVYTDDPYWVRRLESREAVLEKEHFGGGRTYRLAHRQVTVRKPLTSGARRNGFGKRNLQTETEDGTIEVSAE